MKHILSFMTRRGKRLNKADKSVAARERRVRRLKTLIDMGIYNVDAHEIVEQLSTEGHLSDWERLVDADGRRVDRDWWETEMDEAMNGVANHSGRD